MYIFSYKREREERLGEREMGRREGERGLSKRRGVSFLAGPSCICSTVFSVLRTLSTCFQLFLYLSSFAPNFGFNIRSRVRLGCNSSQISSLF